jgi:SAM-dependent methyltransferase
MAERPPVPTSLHVVRRVPTYHRLLLDAYLEWSVPLMRGMVIDLGGKRERKRGTFRPPVAPGTTWTYVNLDPATAPDLLCDIASVPLPDGSADCVICTEVLAHVVDPSACVAEAARLLRSDGTYIVSAPFLTPWQPDPFDFYRWSPEGLKGLLARFRAVRVLSMGGYLGTLGMLLEFGGRDQGHRLWGGALKRAAFEAGRLLQWRDVQHVAVRTPDDLPRFTTGYFVVATK